MQLSLLEECRGRVEQALDAPTAKGPRDPRADMRLRLALRHGLGRASEMSAAFVKALEIANSLGNSEYQLRALRGLYLFNVVSSRFRTALPLPRDFTT